ncbi:MAG: hypothetical protein ABIR57_09535 [Aeromicrobium sp.]
MNLRFRQAALTLLGLYVCLIATISHRHVAVVAGVDIPWALVLGCVAAYSIARAARNWSRQGDLFFSLGWALGLAIPMISPGGSFLIAQDWLGISFLLGGLIALALAVFRQPRDL